MVWNLLLGGVAVLRVFAVRVLLRENVQAELSLQVHAARS